MLATTMKRMVVTVSLVLIAAGAQGQPSVTFDEAVTGLRSEDAGTRRRAVQALKQAAYPEAAVPLARTIGDAEDAVQLEAIAAELNIFLAERVVARKRVALIIEVRNHVSAGSVFDQGAGALDPRPVPTEVLTALRAAARDDNPRVAVEALYAFGALADNAYGPDRRALLAASAAELASLLGVPQGDLRAGGVRVIGRLYAWRVGDAAVNEVVGDAMVVALNDRDSRISAAAMDALGALRYERGLEAVTALFEHYQRGASAAAALGALARMAHPSSQPLFTSALSGRDLSVRLAAIEGTARVGDLSQASAIAAALAGERNQELLLAGQFANVLLSNGPVDGLVDGLTRARQRDRALRYLADAAPGRAGLLAPHVQHPQADVRADLLDVLGLSGDPQAQPIAQRMQQDPDPAVARAATRAALRLQSAGRPTP